MSKILQIYKTETVIIVNDSGETMQYTFPFNFLFYAVNKSSNDVGIYAQADSRLRSFGQARPFTFYRDESNNSFATLQDLTDYLDSILGAESGGGGGAEDVNIVSSIDLPIDDSTPINVQTQEPVQTIFDGSSNYIDAASKLRISSVTTLADLQQVNDNAPILYDRNNISGASQVYDNTQGGTIMSVSSNGDKAIAQQKFFNHYFAGKSQQFICTQSDFAPQAGVIKRIGYFSTSTVSPFSANRDGIFLESSDQVYLVIEKNGTELLRIAQSSWNVNTASFVDWDNFNVFAVDFLYLGGTGVRLSLFNGRNITTCHIYNHASNVDETFLLSPSQPIRYEIESTGGAGSMVQICAEVGSENGITEVGRNTFVSAQDFQANNTELYAVCGVRLLSTERNVTAILKNVSLMAENNDDLTWILCFNPTITGAAISWGQSDDFGAYTNSALEFAKGNGGGGGTRNLITDLGTRIKAGSFNGNSFNESIGENAIKLGSTIDGVVDELWLGVQPSSTGLDFFANLNFQEFG